VPQPETVGKNKRRLHDHQREVIRGEQAKEKMKVGGPSLATTGPSDVRKKKCLCISRICRDERQKTSQKRAAVPGSLGRAAKAIFRELMLEGFDNRARRV